MQQPTDNIHIKYPEAAYGTKHEETQTHVVYTAPQHTRFQHEFPTTAICQNCKNQVITNVKETSGLATYLSAGLLVLLGCCLFSWIPFCTGVTKDCIHECPQCRHVIGYFKRIN